jgi:hypothetical protein
MQSDFRPFFEVVREGRILYEIKHLHNKSEEFFNFRKVLNKNGMLLTKKMSWQYSSPYESII